ncbi:SIR2 family protein [candidate division WOR-3 bacterium]|nr:SIR2 family protein [candidate division WOR-3 bacterium]
MPNKKGRKTMTNEDKMIQLAFSIYSNPGVYAILIGSGVSRAAGIPTGWEIMLDLIRKIGAVSGEKEIENPEKWYWNKYKEEPTYSNLVKRLARTQEEQRGILRGYFEPNDKEREAGEKQPTKAHKAIAKLVKEGYIKLILTTNFDRLIEKALEEEGVNNYQILSTKNKIKGKAPYIHRVTIIKLHGDYIDGEMKNTPEELSEYSKEKNKLLDKIFDDFGLIVCGWSAIYDDALRNALYRRKNRRYSIYWTVRSELSPEAKELVEFQEANLITIEDADTFYEELSNKIEALEEYNKPHPLSSAIAIEETKKYLSEEKYYIKLEELVKDEIESVYRYFSANLWNNSDFSDHSQRYKEYEIGLEILLNIIITISYYGHRNTHRIITETIERFTNVSVVATWSNLYPALIIEYCCGVAAIAGKKYHNLSAVLCEPKIAKGEKYVSALTHIIPQKIFENEIYIPREYRQNTFPRSTFLLDTIRKYISKFVPGKDNLNRIFDQFEYLLGLVYTDQKLNEPNFIKLRWAPFGKFFILVGEDWNDKYISQFVEKEKLNLLEGNFLDGNSDRFDKAKNEYEKYLMYQQFGGR